MKIQSLNFMLLPALIALSACHPAADEESAAPTATVQVQPVRSRDFEDRLTAYGSVEFAPAQTHAVIAQAESQVAEVWVSQGTQVRQGQNLLRLRPTEATRVDVDKARRDATAAATEAARIGRLFDKGLATNSELETAKANAASAAQLRDSLAARIGDGIVLRAPSAGIVDGLTAQPNDVVAAGTVIARVADASAARVRVGLEAEDAGRVPVGAAVQVAGLAPGAKTVASRIDDIDPRVDPQSRLASALVTLPKTAGLATGTGVRANIVMDMHRNALAVPRSAVLYEGDASYVYVAIAGQAHRRAVKTGLQDDTDIEITSGLHENEPVVVSGNYELDNGMTIQVASASSNPSPATGRKP